jgi:hypothetical protein
LLHALSEARGHVQLIRVQEHLFEDTVERTIVLLLDGRRDEPGVDYRETADAAGLADLLAGRPSSKKALRRSRSSVVTLSPDVGTNPELRLRARLRWFLSASASDLWERTVADPRVCLLADIAEMRIGVVTGANRFFVLPATEANAFTGRGVRTVPVVSRGGWLRGLRWTPENQAEQIESRSRLLLVDANARVNRRLLAAIKAAESHGLHERSHCAGRESWYRLRDHGAPDLFLPYMGAEPPRLVFNLAGATCTNAIHRVYIRSGQASGAAVATASWTSLYRLSAELLGRSYGAGVLKLELGEASQLRLILAAGGAAHLGEIEDVLGREGPTAARTRADQLLLGGHLGLTTAEIALLRDAADQLRARRGR